MGQLPYIKFYLGDFLSKTGHLKGHAKNAYMMLLMHQWQLGSLPSEDQALATLLCLTLQQWQRIAPEVLPFFDKVDGRLVQNRVLEDRAAAMEKRFKLAECGSLGGKAKALKNKDTGVANAKQMLKPSGVGVTDSPVGTESEKKQESFNACALDHEFAAIWAIYPRRERRNEGRMAFYDARMVASLDEIMAGIRRLIATNPEPRYTPTLPRWLKEARWTDEPAAEVFQRKPLTRTQQVMAEILEKTRRHDQHSDSAEIIDIKDITPRRAAE